MSTSSSAGPAKSTRARRLVAFKPVGTGRPADDIQAQVRKLISSHHLRPGDRLPTERALAEQFGVSRNSVRQAIRSLADSGLLEVKKGATGGAFIRNGGADAVRASFVDMYALGAIQPSHLIETRLLIGVDIVRLACERCTDADLDLLEANVQAAESAARAGNAPLRTELNVEFFRILARMTRNPLLEIVTDAVMAITLRFVDDFMRTSNATVMPFRRKLLADLRARDGQAAAEKMREHLLKLQKIYLAEVAARNKAASLGR